MHKMMHKMMYKNYELRIKNYGKVLRIKPYGAATCRKASCQLQVAGKLLSDQSGGALLITSVLVFAVTTIIMLTVLNVASGESNMSAADRDAKEALNIARAGANEGILRTIRNRRLGSGGQFIYDSNSPLNMGSGTAIIKLTLTDNASSDDAMVIQAKGTVNGLSRQVTTTVNISHLDGTVTVDPTLPIKEEDISL